MEVGQLDRRQPVDLVDADQVALQHRHPAPRIAELGDADRGTPGVEQGLEARREPQRPLEVVLARARVADDLDLALALVGREAVAAEHVEQAPAGARKEGPREAVDVHGTALAGGKAVEGGVQRLVLQGQRHGRPRL